jgi:hypothetical protein
LHACYVAENPKDAKAGMGCRWNIERRKPMQSTSKFQGEFS